MTVVKCQFYCERIEDTMMVTNQKSLLLFLMDLGFVKNFLNPVNFYIHNEVTQVATKWRVNLKNPLAMKLFDSSVKFNYYQTSTHDKQQDNSLSATLHNTIQVTNAVESWLLFWNRA